MKILFVSNLYPPAALGGYEQACADVAGVLGQRGHQVTVLTSAFRASGLSHDPEVVRELKLGSNFGLSDEDPDWVSWGRGELDRHNRAVIRRVVADAEIEHIVMWKGAELGWGLLREARARCPVTYYLLDTWLTSTPKGRRESARHALNTAWRTMTRRVPKALQPGHLYFTSHSLVDDYVRLGFPVGAGTVIYPGIPPELFPLRPHRGPEDAAPQPAVVLYAGRVTPGKGVDTLVRAVAELRLDDPERCRLVIVGPIHPAAYEAELRQLIADLHVDQAVQLKSPVERAMMPSVYAAAEVLAFPSEWREPFGLSLVEAMATGLPVVSSLIGGPAEIVRDGENAVAFKAGDTGDLAAKLAWVLDHPDDAGEIGRRASADVRARFDVRRTAIELEGYIKELQTEA